MTEAILRATGGLGLFLLGMYVMTEALRALAGAGLRRFLARFTTSPTTGAISGAAVTAIVQSSSATTVAAVGFVSAGLLTFPQSLGVIFGANIGTTATGWIVAILGFKLQLGTIVMPLVLIGAVMRLFGRERTAWIGQSIAGFGVIFVGIAALQEGMAAFEGHVTPDTFPDDTFPGRLLMVLIGLAITVVTQSSSAGVAAAIAAVSAGTINLWQAGALVIGMNIGSTVTAVVAAMGGSVAARRTALAHVIFNVITAAIAMLLLTPFLTVWARARPSMMSADPEIVLVAFHTLFNGVGVMLALPATRRFGELVCWILLEREPPLSRRLDPAFISQPDVALDALAATLRDVCRAIIGTLEETLRRPPDRVSLWRRRLQEIETSIDTTRSYVDSVAKAALSEAQQRRVQAAMHALDHADRLLSRCADAERARTVRSRADLAEAVQPSRDHLSSAIRWLDEPTPDGPDEDAERHWREIDNQLEPYRRAVMAKAAEGKISAVEALAALDAYRWLSRCAYHVWRILHHLERVEQPNPVVEPDVESRASETSAQQ